MRHVEYIVEYIKTFVVDSPTSLRFAITTQNTKEVKRLLDKDIDPNMHFISKDERFKYIAKKRFSGKFQKALVHPLFIAASRSNLEIVQLLIKYGSQKKPKLKIKLEGKTETLREITPLTIAIIKEKMDIAEYLAQF